MRKIKETVYKEKARVHGDKKLPDDLVRFSFKYVDFTKKYPLGNGVEGYFECLFDRLKAISGLKISQFRTDKGKGLRAHTHVWEETSEPGGFQHLTEQLRQCEPWQFQVSSNKHGRIHGILIDEVFYVIWLDPNHKLYPGRV